MNENLDLTKILKGCPSGTKFYSSVYGDVGFIKIATYNLCYPIELTAYTKPFKIGITVYVTKEGRERYNYNGECTLFPSKDQRDWSKFERFWTKPKVEKFDPKTLQPFDKVLVRDKETELWLPDMFSFFVEKIVAKCISGAYMQCIPYNDETKHLVCTTEDCPDYYKWWEE